MILNDFWQKLGLTKPSATDWEEHSAVGDVSTGRRFKATQLVPNLVLIDAASATVTYLGEAKPGTATTATFWRIRKITVSGAITTIAFAEGNDLFDNVWDDRAGLTYT
jgi:hypothetical protein